MEGSVREVMSQKNARNKWKRMEKVSSIGRGLKLVARKGRSFL